MDVTAVAAVAQPGDILIIGMHPDTDPNIDLTDLRTAMPDVKVVVILGAMSMAIHRPNPKPTTWMGGGTGDRP